MTYSPIRPIPPKDFAARALGPLDPSKSDDCINSANKQLRASNEISAGQSRASCMASYRVENLPSWIRHHVGEAWSNYSEYIAQGGIDFCSETDDPADVCVRLANIPENLLDRLEPSFIGPEREADLDGFYRDWYSGLCERYGRSLETINLMSGSDYRMRYRHYARAVQKSVPEFTEFFNDLRKFIGNEACRSGQWRQGDASRAAWNMDVFERQVIWGSPRPSR